MPGEHLNIAGRVQGVGYRPFVYRLARQLGVTGTVRNRTGRVEIIAYAARPALDRFRERLCNAAPPLARPVIDSVRAVGGAPPVAFRILASEAGDRAEIHVPPDHFACSVCLSEMGDPNDRRYRYPFTNCTQCGPRYTLIDDMPYDRASTAMAGFDMCTACRAEYEDPADRRFHAEPVACPRCGPTLRYLGRGGSRLARDAIVAAVEDVRAGRIVAVRGIGGYHLLCSAIDESAVQRLRQRKHRPHKPFAVMVPETGADGCDAIRRIADADPAELAALCDPRRPIVLCRARAELGLAPSVAPKLVEVGLFLPYSPLHHLLLRGIGCAVVATSANLSGEPVLIHPGEVEQRLRHVADSFVHHDRPIRRPADDAVVRIVSGRARPVRIGRGQAPVELSLPRDLPRPVLAVGAHMKNTVALAWDDRIVVSPHIGDLDSPRSRDVLAQVAGDLQRLYQVRAQSVVYDAHPGYGSTKWARSQSLPARAVFHHHAHAAAVAGEFNMEEDILVFTWDGTGYGEDGTIWGGEGLLGRAGGWRRVASLSPFVLPGGETAVRQPWRSAAALCWAAGAELPHTPAAINMVRHAWSRELNCVVTTSAGRLFDAAAVLCDLLQDASFDGQAPMWLEAVAGVEPRAVSSLPCVRDDHGVLRADWRPLVHVLLNTDLAVPEKAAWFHECLAQTMLHQAIHVRSEHGLSVVGLSGGVFQNRRLTERAEGLLTAEDFAVLIPETVPMNDAGISYGQVIEDLYRQDGIRD